MSFETVWRDYEKELSAFVLSRVRDKEIQKEIMQEVALKIFTSMHTQKRHLRGWLYTIARNAIHDYFRKANRPMPNLEEESEPQEHILLECLEPMLASLPDEQREILELTQLKQLSLKEVASSKDIPLNTVKSRLFRAKKALAKQFFSCCTYEYNRQGDVVDYTDSSQNCSSKYDDIT